MIKQNMKHLNRLYVFIDGVLIGLSLLIAWYIRIQSGWLQGSAQNLSFNEYMKPLLYIVPFYLILYNIGGLYKTHRTKSNLDELFSLIKANLIGILVFLSYLYTTKNIHYSRKVLIIFFILCVLTCFIERVAIRYILRKYRSKGYNVKNIVLVGYGQLAEQYAKRISDNLHWGYNIVGIFDNYKNKSQVSLDKIKIPMLGKLEQLESYLSSSEIDEVVITLQLSEYKSLDQVIEVCEKSGVFARIIPDYSKYIPSKPYVEDIDGLPIISIRQVPLNDVVNKLAKRLVDLVATSLGVIILSPLLLTLCVAVKLTSKGPIFFKQERVGLNRKHFYMVKFRSMKLQTEEDEQKGWTVKNDPRVTPIGKFIRRTSLDELPQLFNVLKGDMSLVGPRPERPQYVEKFKEKIPKYMVKHQVRPGISGWAQVHGWRGDTSITKRIEYDLYYIENWSMKLDIKIIIMTFFKGMINKNAY